MWLAAVPILFAAHMRLPPQPSGARLIPCAAVSRQRCRPVFAQQSRAGSSDEDEDEDVDVIEDEAFLEELDASLDQMRMASAGRRPRASRGGVRRRGSSSGSSSGGGSSDGGDEGRTPLRLARQLVGELEGSYDQYTDGPSQKLLLGTLALLLGFFVAQGQALGGGDQGGRWEYLSAGAATLVVERISRAHWRRRPEERSPTLRLLNSFNVGFVFGCVLDALKFAG